MKFLSTLVTWNILSIMIILLYALQFYENIIFPVNNTLSLLCIIKKKKYWHVLFVVFVLVSAAAVWAHVDPRAACDIDVDGVVRAMAGTCWTRHVGKRGRSRATKTMRWRSPAARCSRTRTRRCGCRHAGSGCGTGGRASSVSWSCTRCTSITCCPGNGRSSRWPVAG